ncbi:hypothetical protein B0I27_105163 [Arcticibacter pallidicorallinus]|uniref:Fructose-6-phosphate aldolase n=2 Tax=Arcticibacter pallidicorallinus TaxID=1259464 RepID=A0A2T0U449_9SPHI|nr:hypothetical protein B0I27_105163 [Arcticibacter pallidicorallinus]
MAILPENINFEDMYVIKVKGIAKIPDYVQLRDDEFTLLAYFRVDRPDKSLQKIGLGDKAEAIMSLVKDLPFGKIMKLEI